MIVSSNSGSSFRVPVGLHPARCVLVAGIGEQETEWQGEKRVSPKVVLTFEFPNQRHTWDEEAGEQPAHRSHTYTASLGEKAKLRKHLDSWRGKAFTDEELKGFDLKKLLGVPCQVLITHDHKDGRVYENIDNILPVGKGTKVPACEGETVHYDPSDHDQEAFEKLPKWVQDKVNRPSEDAAGEEEDENDEIPF